MNTPKAAVVGATGMAGHMIYLYLQEQGWDLIGYGRRPSQLKEIKLFDLSHDLSGMRKLCDDIMAVEPDLVINAAGLLNKGTEKIVADTILLDAYLPNYLAEKLTNTKTRLFHISTDCVFSGKQGNYNEDSLRDGESIYDRAKILGEIVNSKDLTLRQSIVGPELRENGTGLLHWVLAQKGSINGFTNAMWNGITTLELAKSIELCFKNKILGLVHNVTTPALSKFEMIKIFKEEFKLPLELKKAELTPALDKTLVSTRADLPPIRKNFEEQVHEMRLWMKSHSKYYSHYARLG